MDRDGTTRPAIQIVLQEAREAGIEEFCLVVSPQREEQFRRFFRGLRPEETPHFRGKSWALDEAERLEELAQRITYVVQAEPAGDGHAVYCARHFVGEDPFLLLLGDHVVLSTTDRPCSRQVVDVYEDREAPVTGVQRTHEDFLHLFGAATGRPIGTEPPVYELSKIYEKPTVEYAEEHLRTRGLRRGEYLCFFGIHVMPPALFEMLQQLLSTGRPSRLGYQLADALELLRAEDTYLAVEVEGARYDMGMPFGYIQTQLALAVNSPARRQVLSWLPNLLTLQDMKKFE